MQFCPKKFLEEELFSFNHKLCIKDTFNCLLIQSNSTLSMDMLGVCLTDHFQLLFLKKGLLDNVQLLSHIFMPA